MIALGAKCELARRHFFDYCNLKAPDFYRRDRAYLVEFCETLQGFLASDDDILIINATRNHAQIQQGFSFLPGGSFWVNLHNVLNDANIPVLS